MKLVIEIDDLPEHYREIVWPAAAALYLVKAMHESRMHRSDAAIYELLGVAANQARVLMDRVQGTKEP